MQWSPRTAETVALLFGGLALAAGAALGDPVGRLLLGAAALLALALAGRDALLRPRLSADDAGVRVRSLGAPLHLPWTRLRVSVRTTRRMGTRARTLELEDTGDDTVLVVLGRRDLGTDPDTVAAALWVRGAGRP